MSHAAGLDAFVRGRLGRVESSDVVKVLLTLPPLCPRWGTEWWQKVLVNRQLPGWIACSVRINPMPLAIAESIEWTEDATSIPDFDAVLLQRIATGDRLALGELYCRVSASLRTIASSVLSDKWEAEDVIQDVFVVIWKRAGLFDPTLGLASAWLAAMARRRAIDRWRSRGRNAALPDTLVELQTDRFDECFGTTSEFRTRDVDDCRVIHCAVAALPTAMRQVIELIFFCGLSHTQVARELGEPLGTVKARARRALLRLKTLLRQAGFENVELMKENSLAAPAESAVAPSLIHRPDGRSRRPTVGGK